MKNISRINLVYIIENGEASRVDVSITTKHIGTRKASFTEFIEDNINCFIKRMDETPNNSHMFKLEQIVIVSGKYLEGCIGYISRLSEKFANVSFKMGDDIKKTDFFLQDIEPFVSVEEAKAKYGIRLCKDIYSRFDEQADRVYSKEVREAKEYGY